MSVLGLADFKSIAFEDQNFGFLLAIPLGKEGGLRSGGQEKIRYSKNIVRMYIMSWEIGTIPFLITTHHRLLVLLLFSSLLPP